MADNLIDDLMGELNQNKQNERQEHHQSPEWNTISNNFQNYESDVICADSYKSLQDNSNVYQISHTGTPCEINTTMANINNSNILSNELLGQNHIRFLQPVDQNGVQFSNLISNQTTNQIFIENGTCEFQTNNEPFFTNEDNNQNKLNQTNLAIQSVKTKKNRKNLKDILKIEPFLQNQNINNSNQPSNKARSISFIFNNANKNNLPNSHSFTTELPQNAYQIPINIGNYQQIPQVSLAFNNSNALDPNMVIKFMFFIS
jgi:hypothetical protein